MILLLILLLLLLLLLPALLQALRVRLSACPPVLTVLALLFFQMQCCVPGWHRAPLPPTSQALQAVLGLLTCQEAAVLVGTAIVAESVVAAVVL